MRRVAYWFTNENYRHILNQFCELDGYVAIDLSISNDNGAFVFFITDSERRAEDAPPDMPVCLVTSSARQYCGYFTLNENFGIYSLRMLMDRIYHGNSMWNTVNGLEFSKSIKECYVENNSADVERVICMLTGDLFFYCNFAMAEKIRMGFSEILTNAIEHGNLNITNQDKFEATEAGVYMDLLHKRENDPEYKDRRVFVRVEILKEKIKIVIKDEGSGFDIKSLPSPKDSDQLMKLHGRGILIAKTYFDKVVYNRKGNEVTLIKIF